MDCAHCEKDAIARGLCRKHYAQWHRIGKQNPTDLKNKPYTSDEIAYLKYNYSRVTPQEAAEFLCCSVSRITSLAHKLGLRCKRQQGAASVKHDYFREINTREKGYILGLLMADGCISDTGPSTPRLSLGLTEDQGPVIFTQQRLAPRKKIITRIKSSGKTEYRLHINSRQLAADLAPWGIIPRKTGKESWPKNLSADITWSFLHGYFDGDGCLTTKSKPHGASQGAWDWSICCANSQFLENALSFIQQETGITCGKVSATNKRNSCWSFHISGRNNILQLDELINADNLGMKRKKLSKTERKTLKKQIETADAKAAEVRATREEVIKLFSEGKRTKEIAEITGRGETTIKRIRREAGIPVPPRERRKDSP